MSGLPRALRDAVAAGLIALAMFLAFGHAFLNYDSFYALVWGDELVRWRQPQYDLSVAPTPHPLATFVGALVSPLGDSAEDVLLAIVLLSVGYIGVGLYRLGRELYVWPVGLLAAGIVLTRVPPLNFGIRGYVDLPTVALIVWAAVLEARRPRRGVPVLLLLGLAGLLRPEAWLFAVAYWVWLVVPVERWGPLARLLQRPASEHSPREPPPPVAGGPRWGLAALALAAPLVWSLTDVLVTGDPLWSLHGTGDLARELERPTGLDNLPEILPRRLGENLRLPELIAAVLGFAFGMAWLRRRTLLPAALAVLNGLTFCVFAAFELPLLGRYLFLAGSMLALFAGLAAFGWLTVDQGHPWRLRWLVLGLAVLGAMLAFAPSQANRLSDLRQDIRARDRIQADLLDLARSPAGEKALEQCGPIYVPNHRPVPVLAYWTGRRPREIVPNFGEPAVNGVFVEPANAEVERLSILDPRDPAERRARGRPPQYRRLLAANGSWRIWSGACPPRAEPRVEPAK
jgi:hypothetical protein